MRFAFFYAANLPTENHKLLGFSIKNCNTFGAAFLAGDFTIIAILVLIGSNYIFKFSCAVLDTVPFYLLVSRLRRYLHLDGLTQVG